MSPLFYFLLWAAALFLLMRVGCGAHAMGHGHGDRRRTPEGRSGDTPHLRWIPPESDVDPVCGKTVRPESAKPTVHDGTVYYFCSRECRERFEAAPDLYLDANARPQPQLEETTHVRTD